MHVQSALIEDYKRDGANMTFLEKQMTTGTYELLNDTRLNV